MFEAIEHDRNLIGVLTKCFRGIAFGTFGLFIGNIRTRNQYEDWIENRYPEEILPTVEGEKFEFTCCFGGCGPNAFESIENLFTFIADFFSIPAITLTESIVYLVKFYELSLDLKAEYELSQFLIVHINIAFYLFVAYLVSREPRTYGI